MPGKEKVSPNEGAEQSPEESPPVVTRTRSGRKVRAPAARLGSQVAAPAKTPTRRTRKSALPEEHPEVNADAVPPAEAAWAVRGGGSENERTAPCPEPVDTGDADCVVHGVDGSASPTPRETAPTLPSKKRPKNPTSGSKPPPLIPLGKPKSGRIFCLGLKYSYFCSSSRFSALLRDKPLCSSWEKKMEAKREKELVKSYSLELKGQKAKEKEDKRKRREENLKRRAENERKAEIVQVIRNTAKIKRMKKKHLRKIEKRDTLAMLQKSQPKTESQRARQ